MGFLLLSLFFCGFFGFGFLLILQYIFITFQNRRLAGEIIAKKVLALPSFGQSYNRALMVLTARDKPLWLTRIVLRIDKIWQNLVIKINKLTKYFKTLTDKNELEENLKNPVVKKNDSQNSKINSLQTEPKNTNNSQNFTNLSKSSNDNLDEYLGDDLESFIISKEKIPNSDSIVPSSSKINSQNLTLKPIINNQNSQFKNPVKIRKSAKTNNIWDNLEEEVEQNEQFEEIEITNQTATIGMVGKLPQNTEEMTPFEKQENKILTKLQSLQENNMGLNHWDLWLDLGDLYGKYAQKDKQKEIYTFILSKADNSDKEKELATFRLIGMN